jgi:hypothetical protein
VGKERRRRGVERGEEEGGEGGWWIVLFKWWKETFLVRSKEGWYCADVLLPTVTICLHQRCKGS